MGKLQSMPPPTIVGRVAQVIDEITDARARGFSWPQIVAVVGEEVGVPPTTPNASRRLAAAYKAAKRGVEAGRLKPRPPTLPGQASDVEPARPSQAGTPAERPPRAGQGLPGPEFFEQLKKR